MKLVVVRLCRLTIYNLQCTIQTHSDAVDHFLFFFSSSDPDIRYCVLASLDERFDAHLAQAENLQALFVALNDEVFEIRELAICTIGRLSSMNPAFVMPFLRKMLIQVGEAPQMGSYY